MEPILTILFFVLSAFIFLVTVAFVVFTIYIIVILKKIHTFLNIIKEESEKIANDIESVREKFKSGGAMFASSLVYLVSFFNKQVKSRKKSNNK